jgi:ligand-binding sensor protein
MKLADLLTQEKWSEFLKNIYDRSGFNVTAFDAGGAAVSSCKEWANKLCPIVKGNEKGKGMICVNANNNIALMAMKSKKSVVEECDAAMIKLAVPVFSENEFLGTISCCGLLAEGSEVDTFLIHKMTGINEDDLKNNSKGINIIKSDKINSLIKYIEEEISKFLTAGK